MSDPVFVEIAPVNAGAVGFCFKGKKNVILFRDGGEDEGPACIFFRLDFDFILNSTQESTHIPPRDRQPELVEASKWWEDAFGLKLNLLVNYLLHVIDLPVWEVNEPGLG